MTVGIWLYNNYGKDIEVGPETFALQGYNDKDTLPLDAIEVRMQRWRDRIDLLDHRYIQREPFDPIWNDYNGNGSLDRNDWDIKYSYPLPGAPQTWQEQHRTNDPSDTTADVILYRDPEPLPLYRRGGIVQERFEIPEGESRLIWLVITVPEDMMSDTYGPTTNTPGLAFHVRGDSFSDYIPIGLSIHVPCWDLMAERAVSPAMWDYSYRPGTQTIENSGVYLGDLSDRRAEVRMMGGTNAAFVYIGWPSRAADGTPNDEWGWIFSGLETELYRYQPEIDEAVDPLPPFNERRIQTLVFNFTSYNTALLGGVWGPDPLNPSTEWVDRYTDLWDDMHAGLLARDLDPDDYKIVVIPVDEPTDGVAACLENEAPVQTCGPEFACFRPKYTDVGGINVERTVLFQHSASIIRAATASWNNPPLILVNHDSLNRTNCDELLVDYEYNSNDVGTNNTVVRDLTDIWMSAAWMDDDNPLPHPLSTIGPTSTDEFWWYFFDNDIGSDLGPMRHAQSGLLMHDNGYSGHANWAFWGALPKIGAGAPYSGNGAVDSDLSTPDNDTPYNVHSWATTRPRFWAKDNSVYFADDFYAWDLDDDSTNEADASASFEVPDGEDMIPGRVILGRRQALEHHLLLEHVRNGITGPNGQYQLTPQAEADLDFLITQATDPCHDLGNCPPSFATPDHVSFVMHDWLTKGHSDFEECKLPVWTGHQFPTSVAVALKHGAYPWSTP
jgi:hypothetical protein